eukprot:s2095_g22.t1
MFQCLCSPNLGPSFSGLVVNHVMFGIRVSRAADGRWWKADGRQDAHAGHQSGVASDAPVPRRRRNHICVHFQCPKTQSQTGTMSMNVAVVNFCFGLRVPKASAQLLPCC